MRGPGYILTGGDILLLDFLFSRCKPSDANISIIANVICVKTAFEMFKKCKPIETCRIFDN